MIEATQGKLKGQWQMVGALVVYRCIECGNRMSLNAHQINDDGTVNPSVVCPNPVYERSPVGGELEDMRSPNIKCGQCSFHNYVRLVGYNAMLNATASTTEYPECSGDPSSCPENEGYGCCKSNATASTSRGS